MIITRSLRTAVRAMRNAQKLTNKAEQEKKKTKSVIALRKRVLKQVNVARNNFVIAWKTETDKDSKGKMRHVASALGVYAQINKNLNASEANLRHYFSKKPWYTKKLFKSAGQVYYLLYAHMEVILERKELGKEAYNTRSENFDFFSEFTERMGERLEYTQRLEDANMKPSFPPTLTQMEKYFGTLQKSSDDDVKKEYNEYAKNFFIHTGADQTYDQNNDSASLVYEKEMDESGRRLIDCEGYSRLGRGLFKKAGYKFMHYNTTYWVPPNYQHGDPLNDPSHVVAVLQRDKKGGKKDTAVIGSQQAHSTVQAALSTPGLEIPNPNGRPVSGIGSTFKASAQTMMDNIEARYGKR